METSSESDCDPEYLDVFDSDEDDPGSEMEEIELEEEDYVEPPDDFMDVEKPLYKIEDSGSMRPLSSSTTPVLQHDPLKLSPSSRRKRDVFTDTSEEGTEAATTVKGQPSRGQSRTRGGGCASNATSGNGGWRQGQRIKEVFLTDEDVPPKLREMVNEMDASRNARLAQQITGRRNVGMNEDDDSEDEFVAAESSIADVLFDGDNSALEFRWSPMASAELAQEVFQPSNKPGPRQATSCCYGAFRQFWDEEILNHIVTETNRYASELKSSSPRFEHDWFDTNVHEILVLFAFWVMLGIIQMPSIKSCFSNCSLLKTGVFRTMFTYQRYWVLNRALHFVDNATRSPDSSKLFCLGPVVDHLNKKFKEAYTPCQNIRIDDSSILWKGNVSYMQYNKTTTAKFGINTFELCESATGYLWSFVIYLEKNKATSSTVLPKSMEVVLQLIRPLLNKGYRLFLGHWFNSPLLARFLKRNRTDCVGTLRKSRPHVPNLIKLTTFPQGTCIARQSGDVAVMAYAVHDKKTVYTISTCHGTESVPINAKPNKLARYKPAVIHDYNKFKMGVDKKDQTLEPYLVEKERCQKWYKKLFKRLLNVSVSNSRVLVDKSTDDQAKELTFRLELVDKIITRHLEYVPQPRRAQSNKASNLPAARFAGKHFVVRIETKTGKTEGTGNSKFRRSCKWCLRDKKHRKTVWKCEQCDVPLCLERCFKRFHTTD